MCLTKGHLENKYWKGGEGDAASVARGRDRGGAAEPTVAAIKPKIPSFAKGTKKENAKEGAEGMVVGEVLVVADVPYGNVEWLGDCGASRHVCNGLSLLTIESC